MPRSNRTKKRGIHHATKRKEQRRAAELERKHKYATRRREKKSKADAFKRRAPTPRPDPQPPPPQQQQPQQQQPQLSTDKELIQWLHAQLEACLPWFTSAGVVTSGKTTFNAPRLRL